MVTYLLRRLLLFIPTLIGATALVFYVVAASAGRQGTAAFALSQFGEMRPAEVKYRLEYVTRRYGLNKPLMTQYLRWLNNISPVGFRTWTDEDPEVIQADAKERALQQPVREELAAKGMGMIDAEIEVRKRVDISPSAGDVRFDKPAIKIPDFGHSFTRGRRVSALLAETLPITLLLQTVALLLEYFIAIVTGIWAAKYRGKFIDQISGTVSIALWSVPVIWMAVLMIGFLTNQYYWKWFPTNGLSDLAADSMPFLPRTVGGDFQRGWLLDFAWHLVLPIICISYGNVAVLHKLTRASLLDTIQADFVRTARAKGLPEKTVLYAHAFRNSLIPIITVAAYLLPLLISGSIIVETVFGINGMGKLAVDAILQRDRELFLSITAVTMLLAMTGTLLADVANVIADPRVSYER